MNVEQTSEPPSVSETLQNIMSIQTILKDLKTVKKITSLPISTKTPHRKIADEIISAVNPAPVLSTLTPDIVKLILSDPLIETRKCLSLFNVISENRSLVPFKIQIHHYYVTLIRRAIKLRDFEDAESLISSLTNRGYPFTDVVSFTQSQRFHARILSKMLNLMLKVYSDGGNFAAALETFNYMRDNGIKIDERTCRIHLITLLRCEHLGLGLAFFYKMVESGIHVSVYSLTVVVHGLCKNGEIKRARELVQEAVCKSVKPDVITFNTLVGACCKRWDFEELGLVLLLMEKEGVELNLETYKLLIDGFLSGGKIGDAERMAMEMDAKDLNVEIYLWNSIILKCSKLGRMERAFQVFDNMIVRSVAPNAETFRIMVSGFCGIGEMEAAKELADKLQRNDIDLGHDVFCDMINGCCKKGEFNDAFKLLSIMEKKGLFGDVCLYRKVIVGLCELDCVEEATKLLSFVVKCGGTPEFFINLIKDPK